MNKIGDHWLMRRSAIQRDGKVFRLLEAEPLNLSRPSGAREGEAIHPRRIISFVNFRGCAPCPILYRRAFRSEGGAG